MKLWWATHLIKFNFWKLVLSEIKVLDFGLKESNEAAIIFKELKKKNNLIGFPDIAIAATARCNNLTLATKNIKHFSRVPNLQIIS